jgi:arylsulfatase A-like enzyme
MSEEHVPGLASRIARAASFWLLGVAVGSLRGLRDGWDEITANRYRDLGFERNEGLELAQAAREGLDQGLDLGWTMGVIALGALLLAWLVPPLRLEPARLIRAFSGTGGPVLGILFSAGVALIGPALLALERGESGVDPWLLPSDMKVAALAFVVGLLLVGVACAFVHAVSGLDDREPGVLLRALVPSGMLLVAAGYWVNRSVWTPPQDQDVVLRNALLLVVVGAVFLAEQGRVLPWRALVGIAALGALTPFAVRVVAPSGPTLTVERPWNVVILALDTVRADQTSILGDRPAGLDTTANLRQLAERGINYRHAISQAPWTIPSFASILTGRYPLEHGATQLNSNLPRSQVLLPEVLREAGYDTFGVVGHMFLQEYRGFGQGYDEYDESVTQEGKIEAVASSIPIKDSAIEFMERDRDRPFFVFAHFFDPHYEYRNHARWDHADAYDGWFVPQLDYENLLKNKHLMAEEDVEWVKALYREEILYTDHHIGALLDYLEQSGLMENTLVVVVSDHGEEFMEHGGFGHTTNLYQELLHVPLIIAPPSLEEGLVVDETVETRRVFGTVLDMLGVNFAPADQQESLRRFVTGEAGPGPHRAYSVVWLHETNARHGKRFKKISLVEDRWKFLFDMTRSQDWLFDLENDPGETHSVEARTDENKARTAVMRPALHGWIRTQQELAVAREKADLTDEDLRKLNDLGYTGAEEEEEE